MDISRVLSSGWTEETGYDEDDDELRSSWSSVWWDTRQKFLEFPRLVAALFIKPEHDGIQDNRDLVYQYGQAVKHIPSLLRRLAFKTRTLEDELHEAMLRGSLRKVLHGFDLLMIGLGVVIGSGAFSLTGEGQAVYAGSALMVSYCVAGLASACSAACYAELCMEYPVSGSAFTYIMMTFGEYPAFITLGMLLLEYGLGMAAVANGFSQFFALLINQSSSIFIIHGDLDVMAMSVVLILSAALSFGVRESSLFLGWTTMIKLMFIAAISITGYVKAQGSFFADNFGLTTKGMDGVFQGTAYIFFAFVAFDAVCNAVEETQKPHRIPQAIIGTVIISTVVYMCMSVCLSVMIDPDMLNQCSTDRGDLLVPQPADGVCSTATNSQPAYTLGFIVAFNAQNLFWMQYVVAIAALLGITTSLLVGLYSVARLAMVAARSWLLPPPLARISPRTQTPIIAQMTLGVIIAVIAFAGTFNRLSEIASLGALFAMWMVSNAVLYRRYYPEVKLRYTAHGTVEAEVSETQWWMPGAVFSKKTRRIIVLVHIFFLNAMAFGYVVNYRILLDKDCIGVDDPPVPDLPSPPPPPGSNTTTTTTISSNTTGTSHCTEIDTDTGLRRDAWVLAWVIAWGVVTISMFIMCPLEYRPKTWAIKPWLLPFLPSFAILLIAFSAGSFNYTSFFYFGGYAAVVTLFYIFFAMPLSYIRHFTVGPSNTEALQVVELVEVDGKYVPWDTVQSPSSGITNYMTMDPSGKGYSMFSVTRTNSTSIHGGGENSRNSSDGSDGVATMYGSISSPRRQQSYRISTKASGLPRLPEEGEHEGKEDDDGDGEDMGQEKKESMRNAVDSAYDGV